MSIFETIKAVVSIRQAAEYYGMQIGRNGMICCPFHEDHHPSLKLNEDYFYCFGCRASGDVIDFTARLFGLRSYDAALKLAGDFGLDVGRPPPVILNRSRRRNAQTLREQERLCVSVLTDYFWLLKDWKVRYAPQFPGGPISGRFVESCHWLEYVEYLLDELIQADAAKRADVVTMLTAGNKVETLKQRVIRLREEDRYDAPERDCGIAG